MPRKIFVSFSRISHTGQVFGFSNAVLTVHGPLTADALDEMTSLLAEQSPGYSVTVLSFQELEAPKPSTSSV